MNNLSGKLCAIAKGSFCLLGLVSVGNFLAAPASAGQAAARSATTIVRPSGASQSVSGEVLLPAGMYFQANPGTQSTRIPNLTGYYNPNDTSDISTTKDGTHTIASYG